MDSIISKIHSHSDIPAPLLHAAYFLSLPPYQRWVGWGDTIRWGRHFVKPSRPLSLAPAIRDSGRLSRQERCMRRRMERLPRRAHPGCFLVACHGWLIFGDSVLFPTCSETGSRIPGFVRFPEYKLLQVSGKETKALRREASTHGSAGRLGGTVRSSTAICCPARLSCVGDGSGNKVATKQLRPHPTLGWSGVGTGLEAATHGRSTSLRSPPWGRGRTRRTSLGRARRTRRRRCDHLPLTRPSAPASPLIRPSPPLVCTPISVTDCAHIGGRGASPNDCRGT